MISACAGRIITPRDTRIGYEFQHISEGQEIERTNRFRLTPAGLKEQTKGQSIVYRYVHFRPTLDLYLTNLSLAEAFYSPVSTPTLGRSQDMCWIKKVEPVTLKPVRSGKIGSTLVDSKVVNGYISPDIVVATEWFTNEVLGMNRKVAAMGQYQAITAENGNGERTDVEIDNLYHPSNLPSDCVIYLHDWTASAN